MLFFQAPRYHYQPLSFIPNDINDKGWIVGNTVRHGVNTTETTAVLFKNGTQTNLGNFGPAASAHTVNNRGHILIVCDPQDVPAFIYRGKKNASGDRACLLWSQGKPAYLGQLKPLGRLLDDDRFLGRTKNEEKLFQVKKGKAIILALPKIPPRNPVSPYKPNVGFEDINEQGTIVGYSDFGTDMSHAIVVNHGRITDLHPSVEIHTGWMASQVNRKGDVLGYHSYDFSIGGGATFLWRNGKLTDLPSRGKFGLQANAASFNDQNQVVGTMTLYESGSTVSALELKEFNPPFEATATSHAMFWDKDQLLDLNDLTDAPKTTVLASSIKINNQGCIIGTAVSDGKRFGFLLTPIPTR